MQKDIIKYLDKEELNIIKTWEYLHAIPEQSLMEVKTSKYLASALTDYGYKVETGVGGTGVIGILKSKRDKPVIGIRAEMDALTYEVDGLDVNMHTCGHDANSSIVLSVAKAIVACNILNKGTIKIIFQPAEEIFKGAHAMIKTNQLNDLNYLIGTHLRAHDELPLGKVSPSVLHGSSGVMKVNFSGITSHAARPENGINAVQIAALTINKIKEFKLSTDIPYSVKATAINGGGKSHNVIPEKAEMILDLRSQDYKVMADLKNNMIKIIKDVSLAEGGQVEIEWIEGGVAAKYNQNISDIAQKAIVNVLGEEGLAVPIRTPGAEDFHFYSEAIPNLKSTILGLGANLKPGLHHIDMTFDKQALLIGTKVITLMVNDILNMKTSG